MTSREQILQLGLGFWSAKVLLVAVELGVFTELAVQPLAVEHLGGPDWTVIGTK